MRITTVNPADGRPIGEYALMSDEALDGTARNAFWAFGEWRRENLADRCTLIDQLGRMLVAERSALAELITREMGKPVTQSRREIDKCAWLCRHVAASAPRLLMADSETTENRRAYVTYQPLGPVLCVMPWNFPFWQAIRAAVPALAAGNSIVLKHASNTTGCALKLARLTEAAGFPDSVFQSAVITHSQAARLIADPHVRAVSMTGSDRTGREVAAAAGRHLKKCVLELGGSDPYVVLADADVGRAAAICAEARLVNSGQSCVAAKRFIVVESLYREFLEAFTERMREARVGDPMDPATAVGPLARSDLRDAVHRQVRSSVEAGARVVLGGFVPDSRGYYYPPTVLRGVAPGMAAFDEEVFGPVAAVTPAPDEATALDLANHSRYGLGAAVFTRDIERAERIAETRLEAGYCAINGYVTSDPRLPFGGIKDSGYGRELGRPGILEFTNIKTIVEH